MPRLFGEARRRLREARFRRALRRDAGDRLLTAFADAYPRAFFLEVGANDGVTGDHVHPFVLSHTWSGIMVEPLPGAFERLRANYAGIDRVTLVNAAIAGHDGTATLHHFAEGAEPAAAPAGDERSQMASLSRELVESHAAQLPEAGPMVSTEVECLTLASLLERHPAPALDLVVIDAEGHDHEVVRQVGECGLRPRVLAYEDINLSPQRQHECEGLVAGMGYETLQEGFDMWCFDPEPDDGLTSRWHRIRAAGPAIPRHKLQAWLESVSERR